jgi:mannose/fructose-specific phosphotransferase system component IIA
MACKSLALSPEQTVIVSGVNLPMLLSFFTKRNTLNFEELSRVVQADGLRGIQLHNE